MRVNRIKKKYDEKYTVQREKLNASVIYSNTIKD